MEFPIILTKNAVNRVHSKGTTYDVDLVLGESYTASLNVLDSPTLHRVLVASAYELLS